MTSDIACGMRAVHSIGVLHNDLKTSNILLRYEGTDLRHQNPTALISDFGISGIMDDFERVSGREKSTSIGL